MRQIADKVYIIPFMGENLNTYLIDTSEGLLLVDAALNAGQMDTVLASVQKLGYTPNDLKHIFITHAHPDHIGGLYYLQQKLPPTVRTYAHRREAMVLRGEAPYTNAKPSDLGLMGRFALTFMSQMKRPAHICRVDQEVKEGDKIAGMLEVVELPGHAYGQCGLWLADQGLLIGGDVMMHFPWGLTSPIAPATPDMPAARDSIRKVAKMNVKSLALGHGKVMTQDTAAKIQQFANKLKA